MTVPIAASEGRVEMATDWASDVKKYAPDADDSVIAGIVRYCGIALQKVDSSLVSFSDPTELARVRNNFLKKKCALTDPDDVLDAAIAEVGDRMKADRTKNRVTVYYLLADRFGLHHLFIKAPKATAAKSAAGAGTAAVGRAGAAGAAAAVAASVSASDAPADASSAAMSEPAATDPAARAVTDTTASSASPAVSAAAAAPAAAMSFVGIAAPASATVAGGAAAVMALGLPPLRHPIGRSGAWGLLADGGAGKSGRLFWWVALALAALALFWLIFLYRPAVVPSTPAVASESAVAAAPSAAAEAAVPDGAGIITETRDEKPVIKVYFATGKAEVAPAFGPEAAAFKTYLDAHQGSVIGVSGYNDPTGNAAANAALSKKRAQAVKAALVAAKIPDASIELIKPEAATDATVTAAEARRVEVYVK
jgi:outer membrane protein OmpA-like peptidoglycan-associated protein